MIADHETDTFLTAAFTTALQVALGPRRYTNVLRSAKGIVDVTLILAEKLHGPFLCHYYEHKFETDMQRRAKLAKCQRKE